MTDAKKTDDTKIITNNTFERIIEMDKEKLLNLSLDLKSELSDFQEFCAIKKFMFLLENRLAYKKNGAKEEFLKSYGGSTNEKAYGFKVNLKKKDTWEGFSKEVRDLENQVKELQALIKAKKQVDKNDGTAKLTNQEFNLALTME